MNGIFGDKKAWTEDEKKWFKITLRERIIRKNNKRK